MIESRAELAFNPRNQLNTGPRGQKLLTRPGSKCVFPLRNITIDSTKNDLNTTGQSSC